MQIVSYEPIYGNRMHFCYIFDICEQPVDQKTANAGMAVRCLRSIESGCCLFNSIDASFYSTEVFTEMNDAPAMDGNGGFETGVDKEKCG